MGQKKLLSCFWELWNKNLTLLFLFYWNNSHKISLFSPDIIIIVTFKMRIRSLNPLQEAFEMPVTKEEANSK